MPCLSTTTRALALAAAFGVAALAGMPDASASNIQVRDGNGGDVFNGNGVGSPLTVSITVNNNSTSTVFAGPFALEYRTGAALPWVSFITYCLEPDETLGISGNTIYNGTLLNTLAGSPEYGAQADDIARLFRTYYNDSLTNTTKAAAFQVALWEVSYDTGRNLGAGSFRLNTTGTIATQAAAYLNTATWVPTGDVGAVLRVGNQDLLIDLPPRPIEPIAEPATLALFGAGLTLFGLVRRRHGATQAG